MVPRKLRTFLLWNKEHQWSFQLTLTISPWTSYGLSAMMAVSSTIGSWLLQLNASWQHQVATAIAFTGACTLFMTNYALHRHQEINLISNYLFKHSSRFSPCRRHQTWHAAEQHCGRPGFGWTWTRPCPTSVHRPEDERKQIQNSKEIIKMMRLLVPKAPQ